MKTFKILIVLAIVALISYIFESIFAGGGGLILSMPIIGGPAKELKWAGITFRTTKDGDLGFEESGTDYEFEASPNGDDYSTAEAKVGYIEQECSFTVAEYKEFIAYKDGTKRAGTATAPNGDVISLNCGIDGEHKLEGGKMTVKLSGKVRVQ